MQQWWPVRMAIPSASSSVPISCGWPPSMRKEITATFSTASPTIVRPGMARRRAVAAASNACSCACAAAWIGITYSNATPRAMAQAAMERGLTYYAVTDHSKAVGMGIGLDPAETLANAKRVQKAAKGLEHQAVLVAAPHSGRMKPRSRVSCNPCCICVLNEC